MRATLSARGSKGILGLRHLALFLTPMTFAACGGDQTSAEVDADVLVDGAPVEMSPSPMDTMMHATITLAAVGSSGVTGEAMTMNSDDLMVLLVELQGLPPEGTFPAHIHAGTCASGGPVAVRLNPVNSLADGTGTSITTMDASEVPADGSFFVQIHGEANAPIACGDLPRNAPN
jgi:hypothetical protein